MVGRSSYGLTWSSGGVQDRKWLWGMFGRGRGDRLDKRVVKELVIDCTERGHASLSLQLSLMVG